MSRSGDINARGLVQCVICPQCGYALEGLAAVGRCPECGREYSPETLVLYGTGTGRRKEGAGLIALMFVAATVCFILVPYAISQKYAGVLQPITLIFAISGIEWWRRRTVHRNMPAETQLRLTPTGFGCRDGLGEVTLYPWEESHRVVMRALPKDRYRLQIKAHVRQIVCQPLDFQFDADEETARRVAKRIEHYRGAPVHVDFEMTQLVQL
jgi:hypothetical protein